MKRLLKLGLTGFLFLSGLYHFINPEFYFPLIPPYIPFPAFVNYFSGSIEILFGLFLLSPKTRKLSSIGIILMLIAFVPSHIYFIQIGSCVENGLCISPIISWARLVIIHPLLIYWTWIVGFKNSSNNE